MSRFAVLLALSIVTAPGRAAPPPRPAAPPNQTGQFVIRLKEKPPPPRLFKIAERLEGQYKAGGVRTPYLLVQPKKPHQFMLPPALKSLVAFVEPEVYMYGLMPDPPHELGAALAIKRRIGPAATGSRPSAPAVPVIPETTPRMASPSVPNDPHFSYQWGFQERNFGIRLPSARAYTRGQGIIIGIVDSGVRQSLADLKGTSFLPPYDAFATALGGTDQNGHGTHVCGTIAQATDNRIGCAGIAPAARILSVRALDAGGRGTNFTIGVAIRYACDHGASVINLSIGGSPSATLKDAVNYAASKNVLLCCAAGNGGNAALTYPAAYPGTLAVGALGQDGKRAGFSQYGQGLGIIAPGEDILQQTFNPKTGAAGYYYYSGTSMATPMVTGVAALVKSLSPGISAADLRALLMATATDLGPKGYDTEYGAGELNAALACERAAGGAPLLPVTPTPIPPTTPPTTEPPQPVPGDDLVMMEVLARFNNARAGAGLAPVRMNPQLTAAALEHSRDMHAHNMLSHTGSDGSNPGQRMSRAGYPWRTWGECVASGYSTAEAVVIAWMNSPPHRAIILGAQFKEVGVAKDGAYWSSCWGSQ